MDSFDAMRERLGITDEGYYKSYLKAKQMKYVTLMDMMVKFNGRPYDNIYEFIGKEMKTIELVFTAPKKWGEWIFNDPIKELRFLPNGLGSIQALEGEINPERWLLEKPPFKKAMIRIIVERSYPEGHFGLLTPERFFELVQKGYVPYVARVVAYTKQKRYKLDINLANSEIIADFRWDKIPPRIFVKRSLQEYLVFDQVYSSLDVAHFPRMFFEAIFESDSMDDEVLSMIFNVSESMVHNNVGVLIKHGVVEINESLGVYQAKLPKRSL